MSPHVRSEIFPVGILENRAVLVPPRLGVIRRSRFNATCSFNLSRRAQTTILRLRRSFSSVYETFAARRTRIRCHPLILRTHKWTIPLPLAARTKATILFGTRGTRKSDDPLCPSRHTQRQQTAFLPHNAQKMPIPSSPYNAPESPPRPLAASVFQASASASPRQTDMTLLKKQKMSYVARHFLYFVPKSIKMHNIKDLF